MVAAPPRSGHSLRSPPPFPVPEASGSNARTPACGESPLSSRAPPPAARLTANVDREEPPPPAPVRRSTSRAHLLRGRGALYLALWQWPLVKGTCAVLAESDSCLMRHRRRRCGLQPAAWRAGVPDCRLLISVQYPYERACRRRRYSTFIFEHRLGGISRDLPFSL